VIPNREQNALGTKKRYFINYVSGFEPQETVIRFTDEYTGKMEIPSF